MEASSVVVAHDPERMRVILQQHLQASASAPLRVQECRIANTRQRDGSRGTVQYELRLEDATTGLAWNQLVTGITFGGVRTRRAWDSIRRSAALDAEPEARSALPPFAYVPELDLLLQVFPHDYRLPGLVQLIAGPPPELVSALIDEFGPGDWRTDELAGRNGSVSRRHEGNFAVDCRSCGFVQPRVLRAPVLCQDLSGRRSGTTRPSRAMRDP